MRARLGVDVGGTFTDVVLWDEEDRRLAVLKLPSVPRDPAEGILAGIRAMHTATRRSNSALHRPARSRCSLAAGERERLDRDRRPVLDVCRCRGSSERRF